MSPPSVRVVIVAWNAGADIAACLASLEAASRARFSFEDVVVVDNGSTDGACDALAARTRALPLRVIRNETNVGYARAANQGAAGAASDFVLFFNPDARVMPETLDVVAQAMSADDWRDVGICGVLLEGDGGIVQRDCAPFPRPATFLAKSLALDAILPGVAPQMFLTEFDHLSTRDVDHVMGCFFFVRTSLFRALGGFDERYFVYLEDLDFSVRAHAAGYRTRYLADTRIYHRGGKTSSSAKPERLAYSLESRVRYAFKHFSTPAAMAVTAGVGVELWPRLARAAARGSLREADATLRGYKLLTQRLLKRGP